MKVLLAGFCDVFILICLSANFYPKIALLIVYTHLFVFLRGLIKKIDGKSNVAVILEVFVAHVYTYTKALAFVLLFVLTIAFGLMVFIESGNENRNTTTVEVFGILLCMAFDSEWVVIIQEFHRIVPKLGNTELALLSWILYIVQIFIKHVLFQLFTSVVISSYQQSRAINDFAFDEDRIEKLLKVWLFYDSDGKGYISAKDYIKFIVSLKPPLKIDSDAIGRKLQEMEQTLGQTYKGFYPFNNDVDYQMNKDNKMLAGVSSQSRYYRSDDESISLSVNQYFLMCRVYNVPVYPIEKVGYVHFMDVAAILSRLIIEARYPELPSMEFSSDSIETMLVDRWASRYPELSTFLANKQKLKFDEEGKVRRPLDLLHTQAVRVVISATKREIERNAMRLTNEQNKRLHVFREFEDEMNMKMAQHAEVSVQIQKKIVNEQLMRDYSRHKQIKKAIRLQNRSDHKLNFDLADSGPIGSNYLGVNKMAVGSVTDFSSMKRVSKVFNDIHISKTTKNSPGSNPLNFNELASRGSPTKGEGLTFTDAIRRGPARISMLYSPTNGIQPQLVAPVKESGPELWPSKYLVNKKFPAHDRGPAFVPETEQIPEVKNFDSIGLVIVDDGPKDDSIDFHDIDAPDKENITDSLDSSEDQRYFIETKTNFDSPFMSEAQNPTPPKEKLPRRKKNGATEPQLIKVKKLKYIPKVGDENQFDEDAQSSEMASSISAQNQDDEGGDGEEEQEGQGDEEQVFQKDLVGFKVDPMYQDDSDNENPVFRLTPQLGSDRREGLTEIDTPLKPEPDSNTLGVFLKPRKEKQYTFNGYTSDDSHNA